MRVYRGRAETVAADRAATDDLFEHVAAEREPAVRVWRPPRHVAFGRRDANEEGYENARERAAERGFEPVERRVGGRAVAYTGTTVAFARVTPIDDPRGGLKDRYAAASEDLLAALAELGVEATEGEPPGSFCPGTHSLRAGSEGGKLAGLAQRVRKRAAAVAGVLVVADDREVAAVLEPVYAALGVPFDPGSVASVAGARANADAGTRTGTGAKAEPEAGGGSGGGSGGGGGLDPTTVEAAVESALVGDGERSVERVDGG